MTDDEQNLFARHRTFEWDDEKRRTNLVKHGIDFIDARDAFNDPNAFAYASPPPREERRLVTVGLMNGMLVAVVFTLRGDAIRIISARVARRRERQMYG